MKKTLIAIAVAGLAYVGAAWTTGRVAEQQIDTELAKLRAMVPSLKITEDKHTRGIFGSTRLTTLDVGGLFDAGQCPAPPAPVPQGDASRQSAAPATPPPGMGAPAASPLLVTIKQTVTHGPFPGFGWPAAARVHYEVLINGQPLAEHLGITTEGEMPVLTARYGFTGNSRVQWSGDAGKVIYASPDGKGGITVSWPSLRFTANTRSDFSKMDYDGELPTLTATMLSPKGEPVTLSLKQLSLKADHHYPLPGQFFVYTGNDALSIASLSVEQGGKSVFDAQGLEGMGSGTLDGGLMESTTQITLASVKAGDETVGPMHYDFTFAKLDAAAYGQFMQTLVSNDLGSCPTPEKTAAFIDSLKAQLPALLKAGPEFRIDRISIGYQGEQANITGKLSLPADVPAPLQDPVALLGLATATLTVALPDKLIQTLAVKTVTAQMTHEMAFAQDAENPTATTPEQHAEAERLAQVLVAQQIKQALAKNWIVRGKDGVSSSLEYRNGSVVLNGQPLDLQGLKARAATE